MKNQDDVAFERALTVPKRGIGEKSFNHILSYAKQKRISLYQASKKWLIQMNLPKKYLKA